MNQFGKIFRLTAFGESHGPAIGGVIDGVPAGMRIDIGAVQAQLDRRRPGQSVFTTARNEADRVEFLSGFLDGITLGTPIGFIIRNTDHRSVDYSAMAEIYRPNHADYTYEAKYGIREVRGGGRASARATASFVVAGAIARQALETLGIEIFSEVKSVGGVSGSIGELEAAIAAAKCDGDSVGGVVECTVSGVSAGLGEPLGDKLQAKLAQAMLSINAVKGFEYGDGFAAANMHGSDAADEFYYDTEGVVRTRTNHSGGIQGGISNGEDIVFRVAFKPVPTIAKTLKTVDRKGAEVELAAKGRHDPCVVFRAMPIVEAMAAMVIFDAVLLNRCARF